ncbi:MAG: hypothetical protein Q7T81_05445 [Pseudolabrys sp.]|nr:hypothetical protein [Pseudolabrys sp.]
MSLSQFWTSIHPSVFHNTAGPMREAVAELRPSGAMRYRCPVNGSLVLVTDDVTLAELDKPRARLRCIDCGEMHLLTQESDQDIDASSDVTEDLIIPSRAAIVDAQSKL